MNKKILAILMALLMVLTSVAALAEGDVTVSNLISKVFTANSGTSTAATFKFTAVCTDVDHAPATTTKDNAPVITIDDVVYAVGEAGTNKKLVFHNLTADKFPSVGLYTYVLTETTGKDAGVDYDTKSITMKVSVEKVKDSTDKVIASIGFSKEGVDGKLNGEQGFNNEYTGGNLSVEKVVTGNLGDVEQYFEFIVTLTPETDSTNNPTTVTVDATKATAAKNPTTITVGTPTKVYLKHGETISFLNLPKGMTYTVTETADAEYTTTENKDDANGVMDNEGGDTTIDDKIIFTNDRSETIDTGVNTDSMPYIMLMAFVMMLAAAVVLKKRTVND